MAEGGDSSLRRVEIFLESQNVDSGWRTWILSSEAMWKGLFTILNHRDDIPGWKLIFRDMKRRRVRALMDENEVQLGWQALIIENENIWMSLATIVNTLDQLDEFIPERNKVLAAFKYCPMSKLKVVIIGHDPIPLKEYATGVAFSYPEGTVLPWNPNIHMAMRKPHAVLRQVYLESPEEKDTSACHISWAKRGVLLLNAALTYTKPGDRQIFQRLWFPFLKELLVEVSHGKTFPVLGKRQIVFWGTNARELYYYMTEAQYCNRIESNISDPDLFLGHHPTFHINDLRTHRTYQNQILPYRFTDQFEIQARRIFEYIDSIWPYLFTLESVGSCEDELCSDFVN